ncbi:MAG: MFS transporter, partial [Rikenellaceae bacterium]
QLYFGGLTLAIDVIPGKRRGEGIGYFGVAYSVAMALAPMAGVWLYNSFSVDMVFGVALALSTLGLISILPIKVERQPRLATEQQKLTLGRFVLIKGLPCVAIIALSGYGYGAISNFIALYAKGVDFVANVGYFFMILASGIAVTRIVSAKMINRGQVTLATYIGGAFVLASYALFLMCHSEWLFYIIALLFGIGFGLFGVSFQAMLVNLSQPHQRGTASATYYIFWDMGIGLGIATGGAVLEFFDFSSLFILSGALVVIALAYYALVSDRYYTQNKLQ